MAVLPETFNIYRRSHEIYNFNDRLTLLQRPFDIKRAQRGSRPGTVLAPIGVVFRTSGPRAKDGAPR
jgi:hypothetical protein